MISIVHQYDLVSYLTLKNLNDMNYFSVCLYLFSAINCVTKNSKVINKYFAESKTTCLPRTFRLSKVETTTQTYTSYLKSSPSFKNMRFQGGTHRPESDNFLRSNTLISKNCFLNAGH